MSGGERFLVTGAYGCIGAWVTRSLVQRGLPVVAYDCGGRDHRLRQVLTDAELAAVEIVRGDVTDLVQLERALDAHAITNVVHLAALQVPFCRADPPRGARVNVEGTVNVLEAVKRRLERMRQLVYASSVAAYDEVEDGRAPSLGGTPATLYGVYKRANEGCAQVYWNEDAVPSIGLRPHTVYGVGRDQGLTSVLTGAMLAAAAGRSFHVPYGGRSQLQFAPDAARAFVRASLADPDGASVHNLPGPVVSVEELIGAIEHVVPAAVGTITFDDVPLPVPDRVDSASLAAIIGAPDETPLLEAVEQTIAHFRDLIARGLVAADAPAQARKR